MAVDVKLLGPGVKITTDTKDKKASQFITSLF
jgi:hypothetical protein